MLTSQMTTYFVPEDAEYVVPFDEGHWRPDVGADEADAEVLVPIMLELVMAEPLVGEELIIALDERLLVEEAGVELEELDSETGPATRSAPLVAPS